MQKNESSTLSTLLYVTVFLLLACAGFAIRYQQNELNEERDFRLRIAQASSQKNLSCEALAKAKHVVYPGYWTDINPSVSVYNNDQYGRMTRHFCGVGVVSSDATDFIEVASVDSEGFELGAELIMFDTAENAYSYAENVVNPQRYWTSFKNPKLLQTGFWTSYVFGNPVYFDSYSVVENAFLRISAPCGFEIKPSLKAEVDKCVGTGHNNGAAAQIIREFRDLVSENL